MEDGIFMICILNIMRGASGRQTQRANCNYVFKKLTFLENSFNKDKSVGL